ncbi:hypothetical protein A9R05_43345 (plasmid) [Burkholderia sp. KK1]|nr:MULTISPECIES: hypothetical protein [Burkholderia]AQH05842.1 hypothetical protein A9R05_43345 [Burkholderia sp. KK1]
MARGKIGRSKGKVVDTWYYEYQGLTTDEGASDDVDASKRVQGVKVEIRLVLHKEFESSDKPPLATKSVSFAVECDNPDFTLHGSDIEALRAAMWSKLDKHYAVKWENFYLVQILRSHHWEGIGTGLAFSYKHIERGTAWDGTLLLRKYEHGRGSTIQPWPGEFRDKHGDVMACIPETKENTQALQEFAARIDALRGVLANFLRPESIMKTLHNLNSVGLPAPATIPSSDDE